MAVVAVVEAAVEAGNDFSEWPGVKASRIKKRSSIWNVRQKDVFHADLRNQQVRIGESNLPIYGYFKKNKYLACYYAKRCLICAIN